VPDADKRVAEYAQNKQQMVVALIQAGDFTAYPDALRFVIATKDAGMRIADASSSKNAGLFLRQIRLDTFAQEHGISSPTLRPGLTLLDYFDADVSGRDFAHGKPDPEIFLTAAHELHVEPPHAIVIEDASAGVQAAKAGDMAAIGIARADDADLLAAAHADLVVTSLDDVDTTALSGGRLAARTALDRAGLNPQCRAQQQFLAVWRADQLQARGDTRACGPHWLGRTRHPGRIEQPGVLGDLDDDVDQRVGGQVRQTGREHRHRRQGQQLGLAEQVQQRLPPSGQPGPGRCEPGPEQVVHGEHLGDVRTHAVRVGLG
jgi:phosphoglycolate phosphatase-like HAD superfamily hydrolase